MKLLVDCCWLCGFLWLSRESSTSWELRALPAARVGEGGRDLLRMTPLFSGKIYPRSLQTPKGVWIPSCRTQWIYYSLHEPRCCVWLIKYFMWAQKLNQHSWCHHQICKCCVKYLNGSYLPSLVSPHERILCTYRSQIIAKMVMNCCGPFWEA